MLRSDMEIGATHKAMTGTSVITFTGRVECIHICPRGFLPMLPLQEARLIAGEGIEGDRYRAGTGFHSFKPQAERQITLFETETLEALEREFDIALTPADHRRNVTVRGVPLNHLVGRDFHVGGTLLRCRRLSFPCRHLDEVTGKDLLNALVHRAGINCEIITGGIIRPGDKVWAA